MPLTSTDTATPAEDKTVDSISPNREYDHGNITASHVQRGSCGHKSNYSDSLGDSDVPGALVETARRPREQDCNRAGNQVWRAGENKRNSFTKTESLDDCRELCIQGCQLSNRGFVLGRGD